MKKIIIFQLFFLCIYINLIGNVNIHLWHQMAPDERLILEELIDEYEEEHPDIEVFILFK